MGDQRLRGSKNVQIREVQDSWIQITYNEVRRILPLESAHLSIASERPSPARLASARAGVFDYVGHVGLLADLETWIDSPEPFVAQVIAGRGGSGKTRLAVELCLRLRERDWLCGFLARGDGEGRLDSLIEAPTARLIVVDYAENRVEQLGRLLPQLSASATEDEPVRVLLLVRTGAGRAGDPARRFTRMEAVERVIEGCGVRVLEDEEQLDLEERRDLFDGAAAAFVRHTSQVAPAEPPDLDQRVFENPLMVVVAAYLAAQGEKVPSSREELLDGVLTHERRYWEEGLDELGADIALLERIVAVATLVRVDNESQAAEKLRLLNDLHDATAERRNGLARWARKQYPGPHWWNPLEPDLLGEHLVSRCFANQPAVLRGVLSSDRPEEITRPLEVLARAAADHTELANVLRPILSQELQRLCAIAVRQAKEIKDADLLYGNAVTAAAALDAAISVVELDPSLLATAVYLMPPRADVVLNKLATTLTERHVEHLRVASGPDVYTPLLAGVLNNLANRLADTGNHPAALLAAEESVEIYRDLAKEELDDHLKGVAISLNNLSNCLATVGRGPEALTASEESVEIRRQLARANPDEYIPNLAGGLSTLSSRLAENGHDAAALTAIEESVEIYRDSTEADPDGPYAPDLAMALNNLSNRLAAHGNLPEALKAIEEAAAIYRDLAKENPAAYAPELAKALNNLSIRLADNDRHPEAVTTSRESVEIRNLLTEADPMAHGSDLIVSLRNLAIFLEAIGEEDEARNIRQAATSLEAAS